MQLAGNYFLAKGLAQLEALEPKHRLNKMKSFYLTRTTENQSFFP